MENQDSSNIQEPDGIEIQESRERENDETIKRRESAMFGVLFWVFIAVFLVLANWQDFWPWLKEKTVPVIIFGGLAILVGIGFAVFKLWHSPAGQIGSIVLLGVPLVMALVGAVWAISPEYRVSVLRSVFLLIVIFLPALLYYLFVALRRISLLQEFFTNLAKLGLFARRGPEEPEHLRHIRIVTYLQKFEAIYGEIPRNLTGQIVRATASDSNAQNKEVPNFHLYQPGLMTPEAIPVVVATLLIGLGWLLVLPPWKLDGSGSDLVLKPTEDAALFAFLGAYFYSLQMLFRRFVRLDLRANAYVSIAQRIILAVVGVWAVIQVAAIPSAFVEGGVGKFDQSDSLLVAGFVVGAFPPIAWQVVQAAFQKFTFSEKLVPSLESRMPLRELDGLTVWHEGRLEEEAIENVQNMSTANIVELMLSTRYPADRIVDWVDQAMLYTQLGKNSNSSDQNGGDDCIGLLQSYGIRTASSLVAAYEIERSKEHVEQNGTNMFEPLLPESIGSSNKIPITVVDALRTNPNLELVQHWNRTL